MIVPKAYNNMHPMGDSRYIAVNPAVNRITGLVYVQIPKNASCWIKYHLSQALSENYNYYQQGFNTKKNLALVVLRDPLERWISAMGQILVANRPGRGLHVDNLNWDRITTEIIRNNHTQPQHEFFANIPYDRTVWFRCDHGLKHNFKMFMQEYGFCFDYLSEENDVTNIFNVTKKVPKQIINDFETPPQQEIVDKILFKLNQHPEYIDRIRKLYQRDFDLFNSVPYYESR